MNINKRLIKATQDSVVVRHKLTAVECTEEFSAALANIAKNARGMARNGTIRFRTSRISVTIFVAPSMFPEIRQLAGNLVINDQCILSAHVLRTIIDQGRSVNMVVSGEYGGVAEVYNFFSTIVPADSFAELELPAQSERTEPESIDMNINIKSEEIVTGGEDDNLIRKMKLTVVIDKNGDILPSTNENGVLVWNSVASVNSVIVSRTITETKSNYHLIKREQIGVIEQRGGSNNTYKIISTPEAFEAYELFLSKQNIASVNRLPMFDHLFVEEAE